MRKNKEVNKEAEKQQSENGENQHGGVLEVKRNEWLKNKSCIQPCNSEYSWWIINIDFAQKLARNSESQALASPK